MEFKFDNSSPIYKQLVAQLKTMIALKEYAPGSKLPSVRELAMQATINPNTVSKAYAELEVLNLIETMRTNGKFVTNDEEQIEKLRLDLASEYIDDFVEKMASLNYQKEDLIAILETYFKEETK